LLPRQQAAPFVGILRGSVLSINTITGYKIETASPPDPRSALISGMRRAPQRTFVRFGYIRATGDIDLLVETSPENIEKIRQALS
jgi:hypothetical protein